MFESCTRLWALFYAFRAGEIDAAEFRHRQHLAVALCYASLMAPERALEAFRSDLLRLLRGWEHEGKYHETITRFWLGVAGHFVRSLGADRCLAQAANDFISRFGDKSLIERHYSAARLWSPAARNGWVDPDALPVPPAV